VYLKYDTHPFYLKPISAEALLKNISSPFYSGNTFLFYYICTPNFSDPMKHIILCLPLCICLNVFAQTNKKTVDSLEKRYQQCLGEGRSTYNCALQYYTQMDSLLNTVYHQIYSTLDINRRESLEVSQAQWVEKKEAYFKNIDIRVEKKRPLTLRGLDDDMIVTDNKAAYLRTRVIELLKSQHS
jgi:uncharacterized protein YecT (DUF1311 family)